MHESTDLTLRERSKLDKRRRIEEAAREVFAECGFHKATTREIAKRAGVGVATLFVYAPDKAQLLAAMFKSELERLSALSGSIPTDGTVVTQLIRFLRPRYEVFGRDARLSRTAMLNNFGRSMESANTDQALPVIWRALYDGIRDIVRRNQTYGLITSEANTDLAAEAILCIYLTHVQFWIAQREPNVEHGLSALAALLEMICKPLEPKK
ncbi:MAG: TetR/AcrR family transcriptional regulator [Candidatus Eremiobacteraeota bacterium]|nr:TetR/AcrR family transcriptional regulator [Candidatus Eremiobacteraeota bacterium]